MYDFRSFKTWSVIIQQCPIRYISWGGRSQPWSLLWGSMHQHAPKTLATIALRHQQQTPLTQHLLSSNSSVISNRNYKLNSSLATIALRHQQQKPLTQHLLSSNSSVISNRNYKLNSSLATIALRHQQQKPLTQHLLSNNSSVSLATETLTKHLLGNRNH